MSFFLNHRNNEIYYEIYNEEKDLFPIVFVHGYGSSFSMFQSQIDLLKINFKLILFDCEGHGKSPKGSEEFQENLIENTIKDLNKLLELLEITTEFGIIGHSLMGSGVALRYCVQFPTRVKFLILLNGGNLELDSTIRNIFWNLLPHFTRMNFDQIIQTTYPVLLERTIPFIRDAIKPSNVTDSNEILKLEEKIHDQIQDMIDKHIELGSIACPTLIIGAELDNFAPVYMSKDLRKGIRNSELYIVTMAGHFGPSQRSREYNKIIMKFLQKHQIIEVHLDLKTTNK